MATAGLQKTVVPVVFDGLDTKTAKQLTMPGKFLVLENCVRLKTGRVQKRFGYRTIGQQILGGGLLENGKLINTLDDDLFVLANKKLYSYIATVGKWLEKGSATLVGVGQQSIVRNEDSQARPDMAYIGSVSCTVWEDSRGGVRYTVRDEDADNSITYDAEASATGERPHVVALGRYFIIVYAIGRDLFTKRISVDNPTALGSEVTLAGSNAMPSTVARRLYDVQAYNEQVAVFVHNSGTADIRIGYFDQTGEADPNGYPVADTFTGFAGESITVIPDAMTERIFIVYDENGDSSVQCKGWSFDLLSESSTTPIDTTVTAYNVTGCIDADGDLRVFYESGVSGNYSHDLTVSTNTVEWVVGGSMTAGTAEVLKEGVGLNSRAFLEGQIVYVAVGYQSPLQSTYFIVSEVGETVAKMLPGLAGGTTRDVTQVRKSGLPSVILSGQAVVIPMEIQVRLEVQDGTVQADNKGIVKMTVDFGYSNYSSTTISKSKIIAGGSPLSYDGTTVSEQGFNLYPEEIEPDSGTGADGTFVNGELYSWIWTYEWTDAKGQVHQSAPSPPTAAVDGTGKSSFDITGPALRLTNKMGVKIVLWRTEGDGAIYYRVGEVDNEDPSYLVTITDDTADADLISRPILYTTGGEIENIGASACRVVHEHNRRLAVTGGEDGDLISLSKEEVPYEGIGMTDVIQLRTPSGGGANTGLASLDDKLIIFKRRRMFVVAGQGPTPNGQQNDFTQPEQIVGDVGSDNPQSIVETPVGVIFKSDKGFYRLDRSLQVDYIGAPVEDYNDLSISSAVLLPDQNEVRFTSSDGQCLVYNYFFGQWSTFTNYVATSACIWRNTHMHVKSSGQVNQETIDEYEDNGGRIKMSIETSWFSFAGLQGFQRIYWVHLLGDFFSHHYTKIQLAYNFEKVYTETQYFDTRTGLGTAFFGSEIIFGETDPVFGGSGSNVYQYRQKPARQKCQAIKVRLEDIDTIEPNGGGSFALVNMAFTVGTKGGAGRLTAAKTGGR